ncbi:hypothetical protein cyc_06160 [Cyclospora cayetanensis]|uniref:Uncharacterized protein n=1 Tax=Cyclospora cayetanensis TaxID=88456 RepID=A0A1D3CVZ0_9EIME|nr:hypothetical protein cyc_06160 [Cyclospora cayetanensis]
MHIFSLCSGKVFGREERKGRFNCATPQNSKEEVSGAMTTDSSLSELAGHPTQIEGSLKNLAGVSSQAKGGLCGFSDSTNKLQESQPSTALDAAAGEAPCENPRVSSSVLRPPGEGAGGSEGPLSVGPRRPCLVLLDLDNTLIPTGWIMGCWRKMQLYFGLQQAVACIRKGLEQAELVTALRALFDDLRRLREKRHTQIVIVTNAGLRTVQEFYLKMCLPELKELCEREKVYIHSTEHFARKYHEFDFVIQRYLNALLCQAPIPLQGAVQDEEARSPCRAPSCCVGASCQLEGGPSHLARRPVAPCCKRARLSAQLESTAAAASASEDRCVGSGEPHANCCAWCRSESSTQASLPRESVLERNPREGFSCRSPCKAEPLRGQTRPLQAQEPNEACCCCNTATGETVDVPSNAALSLRDQLQAAAAVYAQGDGNRTESSPAPSPSESPMGFDPFPVDWRCDLVSAGDQVCEIHAACRVARHFAGHVKFAKLLFLRDPEDPRFLAQTPIRFTAVRHYNGEMQTHVVDRDTQSRKWQRNFVWRVLEGRRSPSLAREQHAVLFVVYDALQQLKELHASLLHIVSCDEETLDEQGHPHWIRRGSFSQVTIIAPERLEAPPRHCSAARVRHAFEYLRKRRIKSNRAATANAALRLRQDLPLRQAGGRGGSGKQDQGGVPIHTNRRYNLSCPLEWERNAVANPPSSRAMCTLHDARGPPHFPQTQSDASQGGIEQFAVASESRSL